MDELIKHKKVTVRIPETIVHEVKKSAKEHFRNFNGELVFALKQYLQFGKESTNKIYHAN